jgi:signal transduction histidine kinase
MLPFWGDAAAEASEVQNLVSAHAVRGNPEGSSIPKEGWEQVSLPDNWIRRYSGHTGIVWYRLEWYVDAAMLTRSEPMALLAEYVAYAGRFFVNGELVSDTVSGDLSRGHEWNSPRYALVPNSLLKPGRNIIIVQTFGYYPILSGLPAIRVGPAKAILPIYENAKFYRQSLQSFSATVTLSLAVLFLLIWLGRRSETAYAWFCISSCLWFGYASVFVVQSTFWPFTSPVQMDALASACLVLFSASFTVFLNRLRGLRWRGELLMWIVAIGLALALANAPMQWLRTLRGYGLPASGAFAMLSCSVFVVQAWLRRTSKERKTLMPIAVSICLLLGLALHDLLLYISPNSAGVYIAQNGSWAILLGIGSVLALRLRASYTELEALNRTLSVRVEDTTQNALKALKDKHQLELSNIRMQQRLNIARDMHDGFGGMLNGTIAAMEHGDPARESVLTDLRDMRDDLRLMLDATQQTEDLSLPLALGPLRRRLSEQLSMAKINVRWQLLGVENLVLSTDLTLTLQRALRECLVNVLRHSGAQEAQCIVKWDGQRIELRVEDDGKGITSDDATGYGLANLRARAHDWGGYFELESTDQGCKVQLSIPWQSEVTENLLGDKTFTEITTNSIALGAINTRAKPLKHL